MQRLDFVLPDWTRVIWNSEEARKIWEPRIQKIDQSFHEIEKMSVISGIRGCHLTMLSKEELPMIEKRLENTNCKMVFLQKLFLNKTYSSTIEPAKNIENACDHYQVVILCKDLEAEWLSAWAAQDNIVMGKLLGYPQCCRQFFQKYWSDEHYTDTSWAMSLLGTMGPKECNILLRWLGVRAVSHLPCSFDCKETYQIARKNIELGRELGFNQEMDWLEQMLDWPVQWSGLHGIAEIRTPVLKISTRTDATADLVTVDKPGFTYPAEGVSGNRFPYINKSKNNYISSNAFKRGLLLENQWRDNGFSSFEAMAHSHEIVMNSIKSLPLNTEDHISIIDFGCGNAELLKNIQQRIFSNLSPAGVELDTQRFDRIKYNFKTGLWFNSNMFDGQGQWNDQVFDVAIVMPGRFSEATEDQVDLFTKWLYSNAIWVIFYAYGDRISDLNSLATKALARQGIKFERFSTGNSISDHCIAHAGKLIPMPVPTLSIF